MTTSSIAALLCAAALGAGAAALAACGEDRGGVEVEGGTGTGGAGTVGTTGTTGTTSTTETSTTP